MLAVADTLNTMKIQPITDLLSGDPTYITSYQNARSLICHLERDEILEELVSFYMQAHQRG